MHYGRRSVDEGTPHIVPVRFLLVQNLAHRLSHLVLLKLERSLQPGRILQQRLASHDHVLLFFLLPFRIRILERLGVDTKFAFVKSVV